MDQPTEQDSTEEQPELEESQEVEEEQPEEDSSETYDVNGEEISIDELKSGYMRQADYTRKTQDISDLKRDIAELKPKRELTSEEKVEEEFIKRHGLLSQSQMDKKMKDLEESYQLRDTASPDQISVVNALRSTDKYTGLSPQEIFDRVYGGLKPSNVKSKTRKVLSVKPKTGQRTSSAITRESIAKMSPDEYRKNRSKIKAAFEAGTIK